MVFEHIFEYVVFDRSDVVNLYFYELCGESLGLIEFYKIKMMSETNIGPGKDLLQYLAAQVQKINATVVSQQQELAGLQDLQSKIERQSRKIGEIEKKLKVLEVYQSENF